MERYLRVSHAGVNRRSDLRTRSTPGPTRSTLKGFPMIKLSRKITLDVAGFRRGIPTDGINKEIWLYTEHGAPAGKTKVFTVDDTLMVKCPRCKAIHQFDQLHIHHGSNECMTQMRSK